MGERTKVVAPKARGQDEVAEPDQTRGAVVDEPELVARRLRLGLVLAVVVVVDRDHGGELGPALVDGLAELRVLQVVHAPARSCEGMTLGISDAQRVMAMFETKLCELSRGRATTPEDGDGEKCEGPLDHEPMYHTANGGYEPNTTRQKGRPTLMYG